MNMFEGTAIVICITGLYAYFFMNLFRTDNDKVVQLQDLYTQ